MSWVEENKVTTGLIVTIIGQAVAFVYWLFNVGRDVRELKSQRTRDDKLFTEIFERLTDIGEDTAYIKGVLDQKRK